MADPVLLHPNIPELQGFAVFTTMHECNPRVPVVELSGVGDHELDLKAVRDGVQTTL